MTRTYTRTKPTSSVRDKADPADASTYEALVQACVEAIVTRPESVQQGRQTILISLPYFCKRAKGFPAGILDHKTATANIYKLKARTLLDWLYKEGYSQFSYTDVTRGMLAFSRDLATLDRQLSCEINVDTDLNDLYNSVLHD